MVTVVCEKEVTVIEFVIGGLQKCPKGAGYSDSFRKTTEELSGRGTSRHPKVV